MKIEHVAIWTRDIERLKRFYVDYFRGVPGVRYHNSKKDFESYFINFEGGARLEIMQMPTVSLNTNDMDIQYTGITHIAFSVGSKEKVDSLTQIIKNNGYKVLDGPRLTGDGYYESAVLDPDGNRIEITE